MTICMTNMRNINMSVRGEMHNCIREEEDLKIVGHKDDSGKGLSV